MADDWVLVLGDRDHHGELHVHGAQWLLAGNNHFGRIWYSGKIDGVFGAATAAAAKRCKFDIGYALKDVKPTFGTLLRDYLTGDRRRTALMLARARQRQPSFTWPTSPKGRLIGWPGVGTHSYSYPPNNWESDNAYDIGVPYGSAIIACKSGVLGPEFGPLPDPDPRFHGIRLHLETEDNEFYYAHLSSTTPGLGPGKHVNQGDQLGRSGIANGVPHLHIGMKHLIRLDAV